MDNYISINGQKLEIPAAFLAQFTQNLLRTSNQLADIPIGDTFKLGSYEFIVLEHIEGVGTAIISREILDKEITFTEGGNNCNGSNIDEACNEFADNLAVVVGEDNIVEHEVDLTADDGLKDYGVIRRKVSVLTTERYRRYVCTLDKHKVDAWWWLATPFSTKAHTHDTGVKCVAPSGCIRGNLCISGGYGVRPFCILKSNIFVSG